ncbi:MAG: hypothetical protein E6K80_13640, partial [Candidatus Eisenbacteria bacterium]
MTEADMARWVRDFYAAHPLRGERSLDVAVDTFIANGNFRFDADHDPNTTVDTVHVQIGQTVMWKWQAGTHTTTSGSDPNDPNVGQLWDHPLSDVDTVFTYRFDSPGVFSFFCRPHYFFDMRGAVVVSANDGDHPLSDVDTVFTYRFDSPGVFSFFCRPHYFFDMRGAVVVSANDVTPPMVQVIAPNGGEMLPAHQPTTITWQASDDQGVTGIDLFYNDQEGAPWVTLGRDLPNSGSFTWFVHDTPTAGARVRVVAHDAAGNAAADSSDSWFVIVRVPGGRVPTTLRDFIQPGTQPLDAGSLIPSSVCLSCHGGYQPDT